VQVDAKSKEAIEDIINRRVGIASLQAQIKEDIQAVAESLGVKAAYLNRIITLVEKERAKGDILSGERDIIEAVEILLAQDGD
jgi:excinuclease UvrABC helicase subunit UvrB